MADARSDIVRSKIDKSKEFMEMAELAAGGLYDASVSLAVSAAINASDSLCVLKTGTYPSGSSHGDAVRILKRSGLSSESGHLIAVLSRKDKAQYSVRRCTATECDDTLKHAQRLLERAIREAKAVGFYD